LPRAEIAPLLHRAIRQGEACHVAAGAVGEVAGGPAPIGDGRDPAVAVVGVGVGFALGVGGRDEPPRIVIGATAGAAEFIRERRDQVAEVVDQRDGGSAGQGYARNAPPVIPSGRDDIAGQMHC